MAPLQEPSAPNLAQQTTSAALASANQGRNNLEGTIAARTCLTGATTTPVTTRLGAPCDRNHEKALDQPIGRATQRPLG